jgi:hypothetical protein
VSLVRASRPWLRHRRHGEITLDSQTNHYQDPTRFQETFGEVLANGVVIELVNDSSGRSVTLLRWDGTNYQIGKHFQEGSTLYQAPYLQPSLFAATWFANRPGECDEPIRLFWKIVDIFCHYMGFSRELAAFITRIVFCSWFPDCGARPITLCICGLDLDQGMKLFRLLHALCRLPLVVAELSRNLPLMFHPTLLVTAPISAKAAELWRASNYRDAFISGARGTVRNISCAKIIFCETPAAREVWGPEAMHITLLPTNQKLPGLTEQDEAAIAAEYQPQLLMFRLQNLVLMHPSITASCRPTAAGSARDGALPSCITKDPEIVKLWTPLLEAQDQELQARRSREPRVAIVEVTWSPSHKIEEMSTEQISQRVNALLWKRGEVLEYNSNKIGWMLRELGLKSRHNGKCKAIRFSRDTRRQIHRLALQFGLELPRDPDCSDCKDPQLIGNK